MFCNVQGPSAFDKIKACNSCIYLSKKIGGSGRSPDRFLCIISAKMQIFLKHTAKPVGLANTPIVLALVFLRRVYVTCSSGSKLSSHRWVKSHKDYQRDAFSPVRLLHGHTSATSHWVTCHNDYQRDAFSPVRLLHGHTSAKSHLGVMKVRPDSTSLVIVRDVTWCSYRKSNRASFVDRFFLQIARPRQFFCNVEDP